MFIIYCDRPDTVGVNGRHPRSSGWRGSTPNGITVLLAGVRPDFLQAITRLRFQEWYTPDHIFPEEGEDDDFDSATLKAVRYAYQLLGEDNECAHCRQSEPAENREVNLYYLV